MLEPSARRRSFCVPVLGALQAPIRGLTLEGGYPPRLLPKAAPHTRHSSSRVRICHARAPYERAAGPVATYTASIPDLRALAHPRLAFVSEKSNFSRLGTPLFWSVGRWTIRRAPSRHSSRIATPVPSHSERRWLCVPGIYDPPARYLRARSRSRFAAVTPRAHPPVDGRICAPPRRLTTRRHRFRFASGPSVILRSLCLLRSAEA